MKKMWMGRVSTLRLFASLMVCCATGAAQVVSFGSGGTTIQAMTSDPSGNVYVAGSTSSTSFPVKSAFQPALAEAAVMRSADLGNTWTRVALPPSTLIAITPDPVSAATLYATTSAGIYKSVNGAQNWTLIYPAASGNPLGGGLAVDPANPLHLAAMLSVNGTILRSLDGGVTWSTGASTCQDGVNCGSTPVADPSGSGALLAGISLSRDWGLTFTTLYSGGFGGILAAFDPSHPGWIYLDSGAGVMGSLSLTQDYGATWTAKASPPTIFSALNGLAVDPNQPNVLVGASPDGLYVTTDGAQTWTRPTGTGFSPDTFHPFVLVNHPCGGGMFAIGDAVAGTFSVDYSPDDGATWAAGQLTGLTNVVMGAGCAAYATKTTSTNAFVAKISAGGAVQWATYLGGSDKDAASGIGVDALGNVYVSGTTFSPDFPLTLPRIGVARPGGLFVTKFSPSGQIAYSALIGGTQNNAELAFAVDAAGDAFVSGTTNSTQFPTTPGALSTTITPGEYTGFVAKLSPAGALAYSTFVAPLNAYAYGLGVDSSGEAILAGTQPTSSSGNPAPFVWKLNAAGSAILASAAPFVGEYGGTPSAVTFDAQGNILMAGSTNESSFTPTGYASPTPVGQCSEVFNYTYGDEGFVLKLDPSTLNVIASATFQSPCGVETGGLAVDASGSVVVALQSDAGLPLKSPVAAGPQCSQSSGAVAKLTGDLNTLEFATYLTGCGVPAIAAANGTIYAGESYYGTMAEVVSIAPPASGLIIEGIANLFSSDASAVVSGGLYALTLSNFAPPAANLGLKTKLPETLNGVEVFFDDMPARIVSVGTGSLVVAAPERPVRPVRGQKAAAWTTVRVAYSGAYSEVRMPVAACVPGLLTVSGSPVVDGFADGYVLNQDGTVNSAANPAALGSTITLTVTGIGATNPGTAPGEVAASSTVTPETGVYASWRFPNIDGPNPPETVQWVPGELDSVFQIPLTVPAAVETQGTSLGNGLYRIPLGLRLQLPYDSDIPLASNQVGIYVK